mmetsp:Transcript_115587/g.204330  ORF Transcript_115587/g.204330 Transcript_115587/m.204330 type:complete len:764 (+) Transcript_115587:75-2366(+)
MGNASGACKSSPVDKDTEHKEVNVVERAPEEPPAGLVESEVDASLFKVGLDSVGHEKHVAEGQDLEWMNYLMRVMWPYMRQAIITKAGDKFNDAMSTELAAHPEIKLTELKLDFDPGHRCPVVKHLLVYQRTQQERHALQIDSDFEWIPDENFVVAMTIRGTARAVPIQANRVGIKSMDVSGTLSMLMSPLIPVEPCVGTAQAFLLDTPKMNMRMMGMKALGPVGALLTKMIEGVVRDVLQDSYILPHRYLHRLRKDLALDVLVGSKSPLPLGVILIHVMEAKGLKAADTSIVGTKSSDPFVEVKIGYGKGRSSTVEDTINPKWSDKEKPIALFVYNVAQLVRVTVHDDDVMGTDILGMITGYNVFLFCKKTFDKKAGEWFDLVDPLDPTQKVGELKLRCEYFDVADMKPATHLDEKVAVKSGVTKPPYLLTVKLLGLEGEDRGDLTGSRALVELKHPKEGDEPDIHHDSDAKKAYQAKRMIESLTNSVSHAAKKAHSKAKHLTGLGFGHWEDGVPKTRKSGKAVPWGNSIHIQDSLHRPVPAMVIRAMEKLHMREGWDIEKIASAFGLESSVVKAAVELRGNFEVAFHEALHFLQPADHPFHGTVKISVSAPAVNQVRGADDHGFIGEVELNLADMAKDAEHKWCQRVRVMLARTKATSAVSGAVAGLSPKKMSIMNRASHTAAREEKDPITSSTMKKMDRSATAGETQKGDLEQSGILIEAVLEFRHLTYGECEMDDGQSLRDIEHIIKASMSAGVHVLPE